jgi:class 3 adenylate cyclase
VLLGPDITIVFRMEKAAEKLGQSILLSESAAAQLKDRLSFGPLGAQTLENLTGTFNLFGSR